MTLREGAALLLVDCTVKGFTGPSCRDASRFIEEALGNRTGEKLTAEFYQTHHVDQQARQQS